MEAGKLSIESLGQGQDALVVLAAGDLEDAIVVAVWEHDLIYFSKLK